MQATREGGLALERRMLAAKKELETILHAEITARQTEASRLAMDVASGRGQLSAAHKGSGERTAMIIG